ncbi:hypothetical protein LDC_2670 [sediment metagenome]|uniref:Uncharacterized protein n=1 Tax=sediment metagenome TaxID=749907 RepID=D9PM92_9ZZZZ
MNYIYKKIISIFLSISILGMSFFVPPQKTEAVSLGQVASGVGKAILACKLEAEMGSLLSIIFSNGKSITDSVTSVPVATDAANTISSSKGSKECTLDYAANAIKQELLLGIVKSTTE